MSTARTYKDANGNNCPLLHLIEQEPEWAENQILHRDKLETELAAVTAKLEKCRAAFGGISEYGNMCKGTDAARMKYLADQAIEDIIPCAHFDLTDINQRRICFHYTNIQPMSAAENIRKGKTLPKPHQAIMI